MSAPRASSLRGVREVLTAAAVPLPAYAVRLAGHTVIDTGAHIIGWEARVAAAAAALTAAGVTYDASLDGCLIID